MAGLNTIQVGRLNRLVQKLLSMKGSATLDTLSPELMPVLSIFHGSENRYLEGWERFCTSNTVAAGGVGNNSVLRIRNPKGSNLVAVLEMVHFEASAISQPAIQFETAGADFGTLIALSGVNLDVRTRPQPSLIFSSQNNAAFNSGNTLWEGFQPANSSLDAILTDDQEIPMLPGTSLDFRQVTTNLILQLTIMWRERFLEESERT